MLTSFRAGLILSMAAVWSLTLAGVSQADELIPNRVFANAYHVTVTSGTNDAGVADTQAGALEAATNGVINHAAGNGQIDGFDTWESDDTGVLSDFVGLGYESPATFDILTVELGNQFVDGGDWEEEPRVFILKNPVMNSDQVRPEISPNWVEVSAAAFNYPEEPEHVFDPLVIQGPGETIHFLLTGSVEERTGWGWAVGGVDGNELDAGYFNFISVTEVYAEGVPAAAPPIPVPDAPQPMNIVSNAYHSVNHSGEDLTDQRGEAFESMTNGIVDYDLPDGFDTYEGDLDGTLTDFVGLQYNSLVEFDTITIEIGHQFGDGGDWEEEPKVYILKNPVDTNRKRPETDPNWVEVAATETGGHVFDIEVIPGPGDQLVFELQGTAEERTGWGWAVGGVDGNQDLGTGYVNFISITEVSATGTVVGTAPITGDYNNNGQLDAGDLDLQAEAIAGGLHPPAYDLTGDDLVTFADREFWVNELKNTWIGDANLSGEFNSGDMVQVFARGKYEKPELASWEEGDFDGDTKFGSGDMVAAFVAGGYEKGAKPGGPNPAVSAVPEPSSVLLLLFGGSILIRAATHRRRR